MWECQVRCQNCNCVGHHQQGLQPTCSASRVAATLLPCCTRSWLMVTLTFDIQELMPLLCCWVSTCKTVWVVRETSSNKHKKERRTSQNGSHRTAAQAEFLVQEVLCCTLRYSVLRTQALRVGNKSHSHSAPRHWHQEPLQPSRSTLPALHCPALPLSPPLRPPQQPPPSLPPAPGGTPAGQLAQAPTPAAQTCLSARHA